MSSYTLPVSPIFTVTGFSGEYAASLSAAELSPESPAAELSAAELLSTLESSAVEVLEEQAVKDTAARIAERESAILFLIDIVLFSFELVLFS